MGVTVKVTGSNGCVKVPTGLRSFTHCYKDEKKYPDPLSHCHLGSWPSRLFSVAVHKCTGPRVSLFSVQRWSLVHLPFRTLFFFFSFCLTLWHIYVPASFSIGSCIDLVCCWVIFHFTCPVIYLINSFLD